MKIDIIVPIYNERENLLNLILNFKKKLNFNYKILLCYDRNDKNFIFYKKIENQFKEIQLVKNNYSGPCEAIKLGIKKSKTLYKIIYPSDDIKNYNVLNLMSKLSYHKYDVIVASRFIKGGSMKHCPFIKNILVRFVSKSLNLLKIIPVKDASNGFRLFSKKYLDSVIIESTHGFSYSLELLIKAKIQKKKIKEVPASWEERLKGKSNFKLLKWTPYYLKWYLFGLFHIFKK